MRWKAFLPTVLIIAAVMILSALFMDSCIERGLEAAGTRVNGAKVELDDVDIRVLALSASLRRLQVTDPNNPMTNSVEVASMKFDLAGKPLAWKKIIIENAEISGIRTGTPRKTSGALPRKAGETTDEGPSQAAQLAKSAAQGAAANLKEQYDPKKMVQLENLASYKRILEEKERLPKLAENWESRVDAVPMDANVNEIGSFTERVKTQSYSGVEGLQKTKETLEQGQKIKNDLDQARKSFNDMKTQVGQEMKQARDTLREIDELQKRDVDNAMAQVRGAFSVEGITEGLIGPVWMGKVRTWLSWFEKVRKLVPQKKEEAPPPPPPSREGRVIRFPFHYDWPAFHLKKAALSGQTPGGLAYEGTLKDVASDPKRVKRPITLELAGKKAEQSLNLRAGLDYTGDVPRETLNAVYRGLPIQGASLGEVAGGPVTLSQGVGTVTADLAATGAALKGTIQFAASPVRVEHKAPPEAADNRLNRTLHDVLTSLKTLQVAVQVSDTITSPNLQLNTNIDTEIKNALQSTLQKEVDELRATFQARVQDLVAGEKKPLADNIDARVSGATSKINQKDQRLAAAQAELQSALDGLKKKAQEAVPIPLPGASSGGGGSKPNLKDLLKKR
jgi:uncharacterized protein (TIGR03545 family)